MIVMPYKRKGEITVFLALILSVICVFIVGLIDNAKSYAAKGKVILATDAAIRSVFAEYNRRLYDKYHLLYIDPSYKGYENSQDIVLDHFYNYMSANLNQKDEDGLVSLVISQADFIQVNTIKNSREDLYSQIFQYEQEKNQIERHHLLCYVKDVFVSVNDTSTNRVRSGEIEYLIYGYENDYMNIYEANKEYEDQFLEEEEFEQVIRINRNSKNRRTAGKTYEDFLYGQLEELDEELFFKRLEDLITEDMRQNGSPGFDFDSLIVGVEVNVDVTFAGKENISIVKNYSYR